jgi:hypothetical protein
MQSIDEKKVLDFYIGEIEKDSIIFLKNRTRYKEEITREILKLREASEMHIKIKICKSLWKLLFEASMSFIDPDRRGYDELFSYFDEYVNFEELIFASDSFYRDHTMHCLWVYFLGEYLIKNEEFKPFFQSYGRENEHIRKGCEMLKEKGYADIFHGLIEFEGLIDQFDKTGESMRCLAALTHDLGYPIKKIYSINKNIKNILPHFGLKDFSEFNFSYSDIHDNLIKDFLNFISFGFNVNLDETKEAREIFLKIVKLDKKHNLQGFDEEMLLKLTEEEKKIIEQSDIQRTIHLNYSKHMRYSKDFENYQHGIMSAFLLFRKLAVFNNTNFKYIDYKNLMVTNQDFIKMNVLSNILMAITDHTSEGFQIEEIVQESAFLTFIDELEEFSRISRANQNRQYINEFCKSNIYAEDGYLNIDFTFDNIQIDNLDPERAFKGRCKRFLTLFNISHLDEKLRLRLRCIGDLPYDKNVYMLEIRNKYANITINGEEENIPKYLKSKQFVSKEEYAF